MGQGPSVPGPAPTIEELSFALTETFATKCYSPLELYCFKQLFKSLAEDASGVRYWSEGTLVRFLELPDALAVGPVIFQLVSYLGAFPFPSQAPAILTNDALLRALTVLTGRWVKCLRSARPKAMWRREIWRGCAVFDRMAEAETKRKSRDLAAQEAADGDGKGCAVDQPASDDDEDDNDDDEMVLSAFESMDASDAFKLGEKPNLQHAMIPSDNFLRLLELLLLIAPITPTESVASYAIALDTKRLNRLRAVAGCMLASFGVEQHPGISYRVFETVISATMPHLLEPLSPLFEHFLFSKDFAPTRSMSTSSTLDPSHPSPPPKLPPLPLKAPAFAKHHILEPPLLAQLASFLPLSTLSNLQPLYSGSNDGFSMGSFEKAVFHYRAPTLLLLRGSLLPSNPTGSTQRTFTESLPSRHFPSSAPPKTPLVYGLFLPEPWRLTPKHPIGGPGTLLFQLSPTHDVFPASTLSASYAYFCRGPSLHTGLGAGSALPSAAATGSSLPKPVRRSSTLDAHVPLGPVALHVDDALEYAVFTHDSGGGGSFLPSRLPLRRKADWQDRFAIEELEVWGCGGAQEAEEQARRWAWEEREAEARRRINLGTGDVEADRELLRMAGIIGEGRSGGSMG
ncbi:hypothetical protein EJ06DRAFT_489388 [Trichodelitschia bisporula]|uniref:Restriction of telomere capping protein 5 n=1 Tax=Trichodelitschia bisporula TaxID=703511 RepID=A0A6G1I3I2_9PEZI|nr:hypothetical protein EJ06DRAFT_489388 [Trichodelitschia bisporula]